MTEAVRLSEADLYKQIIVDLFASHTGHADGCLTKTGGPCQCGWSDTQIRYNAALTAAKSIAAKHDYRNDFRSPVSRAALNPQTEARVQRTTEQSSTPIGHQE